MCTVWLIKYGLFSPLLTDRFAEKLEFSHLILHKYHSNVEEEKLLVQKLINGANQSLESAHISLHDIFTDYGRNTDFAQ